MLNSIEIFSQAEKRYSGSNYNYSFSVDTSIWVKAPLSKLNLKITQDSKLTGKKLSYEFLFTTDHLTEPTIPFFLVQVFPSKGNYFSDFKENFSNQNSNSLIENKADLFDKYAKSITQDVTLIDDSLKTISSIINIQRIDGIEGTSFNCMFFSKTAIVQFVFTSLKSEFSSSYPEFKKIIDSFNWSKSSLKLISIKNLGEMLVPSNLEVQEGSYKEMNKKLSMIYGYEYDADKLVLQQKGLNEEKPDSKRTYVRVLFSTFQGKPGDFGTYKKRTQLSISDLNELNTFYKGQIEKQLLDGTKLIKWNGVTTKFINNVNCIVISYERQLSDNPIVTVEQYIIENNDKIHSIVASYRKKETPKWKPVIEDILNSLKIF